MPNCIFAIFFFQIFFQFLLLKITYETKYISLNLFFFLGFDMNLNSKEMHTLNMVVKRGGRADITLNYRNLRSVLVQVFFLLAI